MQFASVEQQLKTNDQLTSLVSLQQTAQSTQALGFVGKTAVVDGTTAALTNSSATWELSVPTNSNVNISITSSTGQRAMAHWSSRSGGTRTSFTSAGRVTKPTLVLLGFSPMTQNQPSRHMSSVGWPLSWPDWWP